MHVNKDAPHMHLQTANFKHRKTMTDMPTNRLRHPYMVDFNAGNVY
jgi:hypothetical protein